MKHAFISHNGPIERIDLRLPFHENGKPKPVILVGANGSGKTNCLSIIADALFEGAAAYFSDVVPNQSAMSRNWFRIVGSATTSIGQPGSLVLLQFEHESQHLVFCENSGNISADEAREMVPEPLKNAVNWGDEENIKNMKVDAEVARSIYNGGVYVYFPASRSELPHWLNRGSLPDTDFDLLPRINQSLGKPIFVERALQKVRQWLLSIILESRHDAILIPTANEPRIQLVGNTALNFGMQGVLKFSNQVIRKILDNDTARFV